jgi:hypothetical protein
MFENRALSRIFRSKRDEVTREWRKLLNEDLNYLNSSHSILRVIKERRIKIGGAYSTCGR